MLPNCCAGIQGAAPGPGSTGGGPPAHETTLYGQARPMSSTGTWYQHDRLGSVRAVLDGAGTVQSSTQYDPWGTPQTALTDSFGFTGELQFREQVHLRARWYHTNLGTFTSRDPFKGFDTQPYSLHPYQYASNMTLQ